MQPRLHAPNARARARDCLLPLVLHVVILSSFTFADELVGPSLDPELSFDQYISRQWLAGDGLPSEWIEDIVQTRDGYVWLATYGGLARFDGVHFTTFNRANTPQIPANLIQKLYESHGYLWIGSEGGLVRYQTGRPGTFVAIKELAGYEPLTMYEDRRGTLWIGTETQTWATRDGKTFSIVANAPQKVWAICEDEEGSIWLGGYHFLCKHTRGAYDQIDTIDGAFSRTKVDALFADRNGAIWIGTQSGLWRHKHGDFQAFTKKDGLAGDFTTDICQTRGGSLLVAVIGVNRRADDTFGVNHWTGDRFEALAKLDGAKRLLEDREGNLWVGGNNTGLRQYRNPQTTSLNQPDRQPNAVFHCVFADSAGRVWFGANHGLQRLKDGAITSYGTADGLPSPKVYAIAQSRGDTLWIGTALGLAKWSGDKLATYDECDTSGLSIGAAYEDSAGQVWLARSDIGAYRLADGKLAVVDELKDAGLVQWFHEDADHVLWVGTRHGLFRRSDGPFQRVKDPGIDSLGSTIFRSLYVDREGRLWMGTNNGLCSYSNGRFAVISSEDGLFDDIIEWMHEDNQGNLWMGGPQGFSYVSIQELQDLAMGGNEPVRCRTIRKDYGLREWGFKWGWPKASLAPDGTLWFAAPRALMSVPPEPLATNRLPPPVYIEKVQVDEETVNTMLGLEFLAGRRRIAIRFAAPSFSQPDRVRFRHQLVGHDDHWLDADDERVASYTNLRPGDYVFRVMAENGDGVWNEEGDALRFTVQPRWFETLWFRTVCLATCIGIGLCALQLRMRVVRARRDEMQRHRDELARVSRVTTMGELAASIAHEINQPLCAILNNANSGQRILAGQEIHIEDARETFDDIALAAQRAGDVIDHIRQLLAKHSTEHTQVDMSELLRESLDLMRFNLDERGIKMAVDSKPILPPVLGDRVQLQQVLINLVTNAAHAVETAESGPRTITVRAAPRDNDVTVSVRDTGVGLGSDQKLDRLFEAFYTTRANGIGMGLAITKSIVEAHDGRIWAERNADRGATFTFAIPAVSGTDHV